MKRAMESAYESIEVRKDGIKKIREQERMLREGAGWVPPKKDAKPDDEKVKAFDYQTDYYKVSRAWVRHISENCYNTKGN